MRRLMGIVVVLASMGLPFVPAASALGCSGQKLTGLAVGEIQPGHMVAYRFEAEGNTGNQLVTVDVTALGGALEVRLFQVASNSSCQVVACGPLNQGSVAGPLSQFTCTVGRGTYVLHLLWTPLGLGDDQESRYAAEVNPSSESIPLPSLGSILTNLATVPIGVIIEKLPT